MSIEKITINDILKNHYGKETAKKIVDEIQSSEERMTEERLKNIMSSYDNPDNPNEVGPIAIGIGVGIYSVPSNVAD